MEGRGGQVMELLEGTMQEALNSERISPGLQRIASLARENPHWSFVTLAHHIDLDLLREAYRRTRKDGAVGVDGQTAEDYGENLEANLGTLLNRMHTGSYYAPPVRRAYIPKADGSSRAIGIPSFEDKVLQRAVLMVLEAIYEEDFLDCSYGFRPGRSAHQALRTLRAGMVSMNGGWVVEVDIRSFFDEIDRTQLRGFLDRRVRDGVLRRTIDKWLKAGVMERGEYRQLVAGTPQGGVISPLLANIYLHEVLDVWFEAEIKPRLSGRSFMVRYADDFVMGFNREEDARRVMEVLPKRFGRYGLRLHPKKTRMVRFTRPPNDREGDGSASSRSESFDFLGFTHYWGRSWRGGMVIKNKTAKSRFSRAANAIRQWCRDNRHRPISVQHLELVRKLRGHFAYYGVTGNRESLARFRWEVQRIWRKWLSRRSQRARITWDKFTELLKRFSLPPPRVVHRYSPLAKP